MNIKLIDVISDQNILSVRFNSPFGNGVALWSSSTPEIGEDLDVEFELNEVFFWKKNIIPSLKKTPQITFTNDTHSIIGKLIQDKDDGCAALKLGDSIILIELDEPIKEECDFVELKVNSIHLYPTNV
ncbi:hypothetical protein AYK59_01150 [Pseudomonas synxantha]|uniref:hypothetical protein n=1 Tax=Pseudomonas synxantha TaxID=47883 RepID=UPI00078CBF16|nr:hypothetical protein [Pseudomonas synxantha]AMS18770.1 hypothetical protein AYK59_01150 [Pseudomonas synxantha]